MPITSTFRAAFATLAVLVPIVSCTGLGHDSSTAAIVNGENEQCTFTQGFWKNHPDAWPVSSLQIGTVTYTKAQLLDILDQPVSGNGLISLAHQVIAAKLNIAFGAPSADISADLAAADALIGGLVVPPVGTGYLHPSVTSALTGDIDEFNNSELTGDECEPEPYCGDGNEDEGEECDDGNNTNGDGCSATCELEPYCGDGNEDAGEECDDGNNTNGDGCSATCEKEKEPCCGDGNIDAGEQCDDGNTTNGDGCSSTCQFEPICL